MTFPQALLLFVAALLAGGLNSVAGGGSFISFPTLVFTGVPSIQANATNTIALWPGLVASAGAYRKEVASQRARLLLLAPISLVGGVLGALLLLHTPPATFNLLIPFLLLLATLLFAFGGKLAAALRKRLGTKHSSSRLMTAGIVVLQFALAIYGGFFGGGLGILMLATLALMGMENLHEMNGVKTVLAASINGVAVITFIIAGAVFWSQALVMIAGSIIGGYGGASLARRLPPRGVRIFVIAVGLAMTVLFVVRLFVSQQQ
jgi:uncharacterized protein